MKKPMGGTELMEQRILSVLPKNNNVRIVHGNPHVDLSPDHLNIFVAHDLPHDKGIQTYFKDGDKGEFDAIVCVSDWQRELFVRCGFDPDDLFVIRNFIDPLEFVSRKVDKNGVIRFIYTPTPHRGLEELVHVFNTLCQAHKDIHLDVYSSFKLYGRPDIDQQFNEMFQFMAKHPNITSHGSVSNDEIRKALLKSHCFVYPSKWQETSCLCLIEAMSANIPCIHTGLAALPETAGGLTTQYEWSYDQTTACRRLYDQMDRFIKQFRSGWIKYDRLSTMKVRADHVFGTKTGKENWRSFIEKMKG